MTVRAVPAPRQYDAELVELLRDHDAELSVLGAALLKPDVVAWLDVTERDFADSRRRRLWRVLRTLWERDVEPDEVTIGAELKRQGAPESELSVAAEAAVCVPTAANVEHYAEILRRRRINREFVELCERGPELLRRGVEGEDLLDAHLASLDRIERPGAPEVTAIGDLAMAEVRELEERRSALDRGEAVGISSGLETLDHQTNGLHIARIAMYGADPSGGKSLLGLTIAHHRAVADPDSLSLICTWEDRPQKDFTVRQLSNLSGVPHSRIAAGTVTPEEGGAVAAAAMQLRRMKNLHILKCNGLSSAEVCRQIRAFGARSKIQLVVWDYVQAIPSPPGYSSEKRHLAIEEILRQLEVLSSELQFVPVVLSQLNRRPQGKAPTMRDFKDSASIEQKAKLMVALWPDDPDRPSKADMSALIVKLNNGESDLRCWLSWDPALARVS